MPGMFVTLSSTVICAHAGQAKAIPVPVRVLMSALPVVPLSSMYSIAGCTLPPPIAANGPCVTGKFLVGSLKVLCGGQPILLQSSTSICAPSGTPLVVTQTQIKVSGV
jgi:hypothetical protein